MSATAVGKRAFREGARETLCMGLLCFMLIFDDLVGFRVLTALSPELPQACQNDQYGEAKQLCFIKKKCASFHNFCDLSKKIAESSNFNFILWQRHSTLGSVVLLEMFINTLRSEFIENKTIRDGGITVLDYQSPSDHEKGSENTYLQ